MVSRGERLIMMDRIALRMLLVIVFAVTTQFSEEQNADNQLTTIEQVTKLKSEKEYGKISQKNEVEIEENKAVTVMTNKNSLESADEIEEEEIRKVRDWLNDFPKIEGESNAAEFINRVGPAAVIIAKENGIYPSVMIAQAGLESGWGSSGLAKKYNNLMGTKGSWQGNSVTMSTREEISGEKVQIDAGFSVYNSWSDSLNRYAQMMKNGLDWDHDFYRGTWRENSENYQEATAWLVGRYATDSSYAEKLNSTIENYDLTRFDEVEVFDFDNEEYITKMAIEI